MRSIQQIYDELVAEKDANTVLSAKLTSTSATAVWKSLFYIFAVAIWVHEGLFYKHKQEVESRIANAFAGTRTWYHQKALDFQIGDSVTIAPSGFVGYDTIDETKQIVKYAAVVEQGNTLQIKIAGANLSELTTIEAAAFEAYINKIKFAGTKTGIVNMPADELILNLDIYYDPQLMSSSGELISEPGVYPVEDAVSQYIQGIRFGGALVKTHLVDTIQLAIGVCDVTLNQLQAKPFMQSYSVITSNIYSALSGKFNIDQYIINYQPCNIT
jgi:hypothetical protein